ncbi:DUF2971 domain-containing protein [Halomonas sp. HK25]|uniref:DUF2971 domain-containing protein n=1 Tax=Halomonas sp. HK25 TaxID=3394321 RepID=UPI0039FBAC7E
MARTRASQILGNYSTPLNEALYLSPLGPILKQLFKYMSEPRDLFSDGFIRLSQPAVLNDPFEASFCRESLEELASHFDDSMAQDPEFGNLSFSQYIEMRMHNIGVICFSENKENLLMWAHYANEHKGLAVGVVSTLGNGSIFQNLFRADTLINSSWCEEYSPFHGTPKPVSYRKGLRYRNDKFDYDYSNISVEGADRILYEVFMQKSDEWIYEQEHRVVLRLEQADRVVLESIDLIPNGRVKDRIVSADYSMIDFVTGRVVIDLLEIQNDAERLSTSMQLVKLSRNPNVVYLMKLSSSSINNCLFGLRSDFEKKSVLGGHASSTGYLDVWKAKKNLEYYSLEFQEI